MFSKENHFAQFKFQHRAENNDDDDDDDDAQVFSVCSWELITS